MFFFNLPLILCCFVLGLVLQNCVAQTKSSPVWKSCHRIDHHLCTHAQLADTSAVVIAAETSVEQV